MGWLQGQIVSVQLASMATVAADVQREATTGLWVSHFVEICAPQPLTIDSPPHCLAGAEAHGGKR